MLAERPPHLIGYDIGTPLVQTCISVARSPRAASLYERTPALD